MTPVVKSIIKSKSIVELYITLPNASIGYDKLKELISELQKVQCRMEMLDPKKAAQHHDYETTL
jgi:hypothetical protein